MAEVDVFDIELHHNEISNGQKNNSDSDDELLEIEEVKFNKTIYAQLSNFD